jgi:hypothetical protein
MAHVFLPFLVGIQLNNFLAAHMTELACAFPTGKLRWNQIEFGGYLEEFFSKTPIRVSPKSKNVNSRLYKEMSKKCFVASSQNNLRQRVRASKDTKAFDFVSARLWYSEYSDLRLSTTARGQFPLTKLFGQTFPNVRRVSNHLEMGRDQDDST